MEDPHTETRRRLAALSRAGLAVFVVVWLFGPSELRTYVPLWLPFLIMLGLEVEFFLTARRAPAGRTPADRGPQEVDRELFGYPDEPEEWDEEDEEDEEDEVDEVEGPDWEPDEPRRARPWRGLAAGFAVIAALGALAWLVDERSGWKGLSEAERTAAAARFSAEAGRIAGKPVEIICDESGRHVGYVQHTDGVAQVGGRIAYLAPDRCHALYRLAFKGETDGATGRGIAVLAHEAWHLRGVRDEGTTECYALQSGVELGRRLGLPQDEARRLMRRALVENAAPGTSYEYRVGPDCRDGGRLDLDPESTEFP